MPESLLTILKFLLVALLYLFFFRVLRAVWAEVQTRGESAPRPRPRRAGRAGRERTPQLKIVEPSPQRGRSFALGDEVTVGRAAGCGVRVDDTYASQLHARVFQRDGQYHVEDLGSTNGTYVNRRGTRSRDKVTTPMVVGNGDRIIIGQTVLEVVR